MPTKLTINGKAHSVSSSSDTPLLWVLRDELGMTGTKFGCGRGFCGSCTVLADGEAIRSCSTALENVAGKKITTIEGLSPDGSHPLQKAWLAENVPQCGYCQAGQIMNAAALLAKTKHPTDAQIDEAMSGNLCRCGTYQRIRRAIHRAAGDQVLALNEVKGKDPLRENALALAASGVSCSECEADPSPLAGIRTGEEA
jgi:isoquinoline 1-oxidoreductase subunit alpha